MMSASPVPAPSLELPCEPAAVDDFLSRPTPGALATLAHAPGPFVVLGAGGKIGLHLSAMLALGLRQLGRGTERVIAVSRFSTLHDQDAFKAFGVETIACDLTDAKAVAALPEAPTVFFLAGVKFGTASSPELLRQMNAEMPKIVAARYARSRIVAFSTGCVYPFVSPDSGGATEDTPPAPPGDYAQSCLAREQAFAAGSLAHGTPVTLLRLNYSVEFRYGVLVDIAQKVLADAPVDVTTGYANVIWQNDAVGQTIQALEVAGSPAVPLNITGAEILSVRKLAERFGQLLDRPVRIVGREADTAWLNNAAYSHRRFGAPAVSVEQMQRWIAAWLSRRGETWHKPTGFENRDGRF